MDKLKKHNLLLYVSVFSVVLILLLVVLIGVYFAEAEATGIAQTVFFEIGSEEEKRTLYGWQSEKADEEKICYVFLPADTENVALYSKDGFTVDAGDFPVNKTVNINDIELQREYPCYVYKDGKEYSDGKLVFKKSEIIPSFFIDTQSGSMEYLHADKRNDEKGFYSIWAERGIDSKGTITEFSGRGNTSWEHEKKGYSLVFEKPVSLLDMEPANKYVLVSNGTNNYLSNTISFWLEEEIGVKNVTQSKHIDLYLNGEYRGNYILCEPVYVGENGIDINNLDTENFIANPGIEKKDLEQFSASDGNSKGFLWKKESENITGGYLIERDVSQYYTEDDCGFIIDSGDHFVIKSPEFADKRQVEYIQSYVQEAYHAISAEDGINPTTGKKYSEYIDVESFVLKYTLEEFLGFNDAGRSSAYYYKDVNGLLCAGPGWDFGGVFLGICEHITYLNSTPYSTDWYEKLCEQQDFLSEVQSCYNEKLFPAVEKLLNSEMQKMIDSIDASVRMDAIRWQRENYEQEYLDARLWMKNRKAFLTEFSEAKDDIVTVTIETPWQNKAYVYLKRGEVLKEEQLPELINGNSTLLGFADAGTGELYSFDKPVTEDFVLNSMWQNESQPLISSLWGRFSQLLPALLFCGMFFIAGVIYLSRIIKRRK